MSASPGTGGGAAAGLSEDVTGATGGRRRPWALCALLLAVMLAGVALGSWQLARRAWKHDLIARVEARLSADPIPVPGPPAWSGLSRTNSEYLKVRANGVFLDHSDTFVQAVTERGAGFWLMTALRTQDGFLVFINRGFVPAQSKDAARRLAPSAMGTTGVTGLLRLSEPGGGFLRANDPAAERWYSRDVQAIATARGFNAGEKVAPFFIDADANTKSGDLPIGGMTVVAFPDNHLIYALTWFTLAAMALMGAVWTWRRRE